MFQAAAGRAKSSSVISSIAPQRVNTAEAWRKNIPTAARVRPSHTIVQRKCAECEDTEKTLQTKLAISEPGDALEQEADRVADQVMLTPATSASLSISKLSEKGAARSARTNGKGGAGEDVNGRVTAQVESLHGRGSLLPHAERTFFESRFGRDFSDVRIHTDAKAAHLAKDVNAHAFTVGSDIVFGAGQYAPHTQQGRRLLAHELTHTVQQQSVAAQIQRMSIKQYHADKGDCGARNIQWVFSLDKPAPEDGYIVQQIDWYRFVTKCPDPAIGPPAPFQNYWEAWFVKKGDTVDWTTTRDGWTDGNNYLADPSTAGTDVALGKVGYFKKSKTGDLGDIGVAPADPKSDWGPHKGGDSGDLPSTKSRPAWWSSPDESIAERGVWSWWNCCDPDPKKHTKTFEVKP